MPTLLLQFLTQSKQILLDLTMPLTTLVFVAQNSDNRETLLYAIFISNSKLPPTKLLLYQQMSYVYDVAAFQKWLTVVENCPHES